MRYGLLVPGIALCIALQQVWLTRSCDGATEAALSEPARAAIEIRCGERDGPAGRDCRSLLEKLYLAGRLDPERTLRDHCTRSRTVRWGVRPPSPPALCVQRYGGWQQG